MSQPSHFMSFRCHQKYPSDAAKSVVYLLEGEIGLYFSINDLVTKDPTDFHAYLDKSVAREYAARILELCDADF